MPGPPDESAEDLYENAPCGYLSTDPDGLIVRVNATFLRWTGHRREELVGRRRFAELLTGGGRIYHETHYAPLLRLQGSVREIALDIVRADGTRLPVLVNSELRGETVRTTVFDATDRKRYEQELLAARNREREARERVERLQRITAALAVAPTAGAVAAAVAGELTEHLGASGAGVARREGGELRVLAVAGELPPDAFAGPAGFDAGAEGGRGARARLGPDGGGRLAVAFAGPHAFTPDERAFLRACAEQTVLALERVRLDELQRSVAHTLQRSLLAGALPADPRYEVATAYRPAMADLEVGGDWYDAFLAARRARGDQRRRRRRARHRGREHDGAAAERRARARRRRHVAGGAARAPRHVRRAGRARALRDARLRGRRARDGPRPLRGGRAPAPAAARAGPAARVLRGRALDAARRHGAR